MVLYSANWFRYFGNQRLEWIKSAAKQLWQGCGLLTAPFSLLTADTDWQQVVNMLGLPLIIKPVHEGSSIGMTKVNNLDELPAAYATAVQCGDAVMAERWITWARIYHCYYR